MNRHDVRKLGHTVILVLVPTAGLSGVAMAQDARAWALERLLPRGDDPANIVDQNDFMSSASPDGKSIVFTSGRSGTLRLHRMGTDGSNQHVISNGPGPQLQATWSPDSKRIVYVQREGKEKYLVIMNADGTDPRRMNQPLGSWPIPSWSPDGTRILYNAPGPRGGDDIMAIDPLGDVPEFILGSPQAERHAAWSPDGNQVVFTSRRDGSDYEVYVAAVDGGKWTQLTDNKVDDYTPSWSPAGDKILFQSQRCGKWTIMVVDPDGSNEKPLTQYPMQYDPGWSHDGTQIFFNSDRDGRRGIYVMNADGTHQRKLTNTEPSTFVTVVRRAGVNAAARVFRQARATDPDGVYFYEREVEYLGEKLLEIGYLERARTLFEVNVEAYPASRKARVNLATACYAAGDLRRALEGYERALEIESGYIGTFDLDNDQITRLIEQLKDEIRRSP